MELFDLPGVGANSMARSPARDKVGENAEESQNLARQSLSDDDYEAAIMHFKKAVEQGAEEVDFELGAAYETADMVPQAFLQYEKARKTKENGDLFIGLSTLYKRNGEVQAAVKQLEDGIKKEPHNAYLHFKLAETLRQMGYRKAARSAVEGAVAVAPDDPFYHYWLGDLLLEMGEFEEAGKSVQAAIELSPGDELLFQLAGICLWGQGKYPEAIRATRLAGDMEADNMVHALVLHKFLVENGQTEEAALEEAKVSRAEEYERDKANRVLKPLGLSV